MQSLKSSYPYHPIPGKTELGFCTIKVLSDNIAEITINEGVEVTGAMVAQSFDVLREMLHTPFCLMVNECNAHSYDFRAQTVLGETRDLLAVALVCDKPLMDIAACCLMRVPRPTRWPMAVFSNKEDAMAFLQALQMGGMPQQRTVKHFPHVLAGR